MIAFPNNPPPSELRKVQSDLIASIVLLDTQRTALSDWLEFGTQIYNALGQVRDYSQEVLARAETLLEKAEGAT